MSRQSECAVSLRGDAFFAGGTVGFEQSAAVSYSRMGEYECELTLKSTKIAGLGTGELKTSDRDGGRVHEGRQTIGPAPERNQKRPDE